MYIWDNNKHSVGIEEIDEQHKMLFDVTNDIYKCIINNKLDILDNLLLKIIIHAKLHLKTENEYLLVLSKNSSEEIKKIVSEHIIEHDNFIDVILIKIYEHVFNKKIIVIDIAIFLNNWLNNHVIYDDVVLFNLLKI